jgi:hypothetical protein
MAIARRPLQVLFGAVFATGDEKNSITVTAMKAYAFTTTPRSSMARIARELLRRHKETFEPNDGEAVHTNSAEGYFSIFKRGTRVYQHCKEKHLHRYLAEYDFRYDDRVALGYNDGKRAALPSRMPPASASHTGLLVSRTTGLRRKGFCANAKNSLTRSLRFLFGCAADRFFFSVARPILPLAWGQPRARRAMPPRNGVAFLPG